MNICSGTAAAYMKGHSDYILAGVEDIQPCVQGSWPLLESVCLCNEMDHHDTLGVEELLHSCRPLLKTLHLTETDYDLAC